MLVQNLHFFDKFGHNLNLEYDSTAGRWTGRLFFKNTSVYLFDNENIFILEKSGNNYVFPMVQINGSIRCRWEDSKNKDEIYLYNVVRDTVLREDFLNPIREAEFTYFNYVNSPGPATLGEPLMHSGLLEDVPMPLQLNIAFSPTQEEIFTRTLIIESIIDTGNNLPMSGITTTEIARIEFYGEGIDEEERFRVWAQNFGIRFLKEDANVLKDYDIKEAFPDMDALNKARKQLLVNKEEIYPYLGTYKGLMNFIGLLGYGNVLKVKEYWNNINSKSPYYNKLSMVDILDYLDDGVIDTLDLMDKDKNLKSGRQFKKTEFLALVYEFTATTGEYDDDGVPLVEETTEFTVNEIFYKLDILEKKLKNEFLPINVKIKDVIGEFIYFQKLTINYWPDSTRILDFSLNEDIPLSVYPGNNVNFVLRSLDPLYKPKYPGGIDFAAIRYNESSPNPFENYQRYAKSEIPGIVDYITEFYDNIRDQRFPNLQARLTWENGDDPQRIIGAPVILKADIQKFKIGDLSGTKIEDFGPLGNGLPNYWTFENIDFKNNYEINWRITKPGPNPYEFSHRGTIVDLQTLPHFFPYAGKYRVTMEIFDFYGNVSVFSKFITVDDGMKPEIIGFTKLEDKFEYSISNLSNAMLQDFGASPIYYPKVNVLDNEDAAVNINLYKNLIEWASFYKNRYGLGQNIYDLEIYDDNTSTYIPYNDPFQLHPKKRYWGLGETDHPITIKDFRDLEIGSLYWLRLADLVYVDDFEAGFYFENPTTGDRITISKFTPYVIPSFTNLDDLCSILNLSTHPAISLFTYEVLTINGNPVIHAEARFLSKELYHMIEYDRPVGAVTTTGDQFTYFTPKKVFSQRTVNYLTNTYPNFKEENLFLFAKTSDVLDDSVSDPQYWINNEYWKFTNNSQYGYLPSVIDQNSFNINEIKIFNSTFNIPENGIATFVVNNLDGKNDFVWTLSDYETGTEIIRVKSVPFFMWKFKDIGAYSLKVTVTDNRGTEYTNSIENFIRVLDKRNYTTNVEERLNLRKNKLIENHNF
jgi:hypothetical protein